MLGPDSAHDVALDRGERNSERVCRNRMCARPSIDLRPPRTGRPNSLPCLCELLPHSPPPTHLSHGGHSYLSAASAASEAPPWVRSRRRSMTCGSWQPRRRRARGWWCVSMAMEPGQTFCGEARQSLRGSQNHLERRRGMEGRREGGGGGRVRASESSERRKEEETGERRERGKEEETGIEERRERGIEE